VLIGDDQRLAQVITNLLSNAVKFTPEEGNITLDSRLLSETNEMCRIEISVTDTGIGITDENKKRLFESFEQADAGIARNFGGTGLGLPISKRIVELMDGNIWVESQTGKGSKFFFSVLLKRADNSEYHDGKDNNIINAYADFTGRTILLAEDVEINREIVMTLLEPTKLIIECAENGTAAVRMFTEAPDKYDLIFMDIQMPEMDGYEATQTIRAFERNLSMANPKWIPIIAMTANVFREDVERCLEAGMNDHLKKPIDLNSLINILKKYLG
jgi:CheY-like chemotaxis protein/anti-sigma regulatory factor (Ser/Thr protein kinase)